MARCADVRWRFRGPTLLSRGVDGPGEFGMGDGGLGGDDYVGSIPGGLQSDGLADPSASSSDEDCAAS